MSKETIILLVILSILIVIMMLLTLNQKKRVLEWLKWAVSQAEAELGKYTGQLKLGQVYDMFVERFPILSSILPFSMFSAWVDTALKTMNAWLDSKNAISHYIRTGEIVTEDKSKISEINK